MPTPNAVYGECDCNDDNKGTPDNELGDWVGFHGC